MSEYRLLALDLDGTLLARGGVVQPRDRQAIDRLRAQGVAVTILTGRLATGSLAAAAACDIDGVIGCCDGSHLFDVGANATVAHHGLPPTAARRLREVVRDLPLSCSLFGVDGIVLDQRGHAFAEYLATWSPRVEVREALDEAAWFTEPGPLACLAVGAHDDVVAAATALGDVAPQLNIATFAVPRHPGMHAMWMRASGRSKGSALAELCQHYGVPLERAVVVGDWWNDVPMFEVAGRSFAMPHAPDEVKRAATDVLTHPDAIISDAVDAAWPELA